MHQITYTTEQENAINELQKMLGFDRMLIIGLDSTYEKSSLLFRNIHPSFVPGILEQQTSIIKNIENNQELQAPVLRPVS